MQTMDNCIAFQLPRAQRNTNTSRFSNAKSGLNRYKLLSKTIVRLLVFPVLAAIASAFAGCATENASDLPWNTPQPWEGAPAIPGFQQP